MGPSDAMNRYHEERGTAILELALIAPLLLFLVFAGLELSRVLDRAQWATQLSREVASISYRECSSLTDTKLSACLKRRAISKIKEKTEVLASGTEFVVAVFTYTPPTTAGGSGTVTRTALEGDTTYRSMFESASHQGFTKTILENQISNDTDGSPGMALKKNKLLVAASAYIPYRPSFIGVSCGMGILLPRVVSASTAI